MNPELPQVRPTVEAAPQIPGGVEFFPDGTSRSAESRPIHPAERLAPVQETAPLPVQAMPPVDVTQIDVPQITATTTQSSAGLAAGLPAIAADDDLMEKEWVDKVKKIIALTRGNPYEQAKSIAILQADYLKKRYNRTIGSSDDQKAA